MPDVPATFDSPEAAASLAVGAVGERVHALCDGMGLSLRDLAERSGVSAPMLSQVERGETSPTLATAAKIAHGLDLTLSQLLRLDEGLHVAIVRAADRRTVRREGHTIEELTPPLPGQRAELTLHRLEGGAATGRPGDTPIHEPGSRETVLVEKGSARLILDAESYELAEGDSVTFDADLSHHFENHGSTEAVLVAVVTSGLRRQQ